MIELCRALMFSPPLLCLDEPFNFLGQDSRTEIIRYIKDEASKHCNIVIATHYPEEIAELQPEILTFSGSLPVTDLTVRTENLNAD
ncbi:MAG: hypothetical protein JST93_34880 [Acidobacteria bacterium]|nr:hypothetical protein [Acidobacteriota bacterium]